MEFIQQNILLIAIAVFSGTMVAVMSFRRPAGSSALTTTQATLLINREDAQIIDLREPDEYVSGHLPESRNIPAARLEQRAGELDKFKAGPILLICQNGSRSTAAGKQLEQLGFARVSCLDGGINAWRAAGLPLKKGSKK